MANRRRHLPGPSGPGYRKTACGLVSARWDIDWARFEGTGLKVVDLPAEADCVRCLAKRARRAE